MKEAGSRTGWFEPNYHVGRSVSLKENAGRRGRCARRKRSKNETSFFEGESGQERLVRVDKTEFYTGAAGCENVVDPSLLCVP